MTTFEVEIKGATPILMASAKSMASQQQAQIGIKTKATKSYNPTLDAEKYAYRLPNGNLYLPIASAIKGALLNASKFKKLEKSSLKSYVAAGIQITPEVYDLKTKKYDIDTRTGVLQTVPSKPRVVIHRPRVNKWIAKFDLFIDDELFKKEHHAQIYSLLKEAGLRVGILAFRPERNGMFGKFEVTKWKLKH